ncbi:MAG: glycosyltransferase family 1 protein [Planctomycetota bacterium]
MTRAPRVLIAGACLGQGPGGVRRHNEELLPRLDALLREDGGGVAVLEGATPLAFALPDTVERIPSDVPFQPVHRRVLAESRALRTALSDAADRGRPFDLVHTAHLPAPRRLGLPFTITLHDLRSLDPGRVPLTRRLMGRRVLQRATRDALRVLCVSDAVREQIEQEFPDARGRVVRIGNGADHLPLLPRAPVEPPFLLHVGHVEPRKNVEVLVRALAADRDLPRLMLVGVPKGRALERVLALAAELGVERRIEARGPVGDDELAALYASASCSVFPSRLEGFGIGPAEALRAGCPVALSEIPAHREAAGEGPPGFDPDDPVAAANAIRRALAAATPSRPEHTWDACAGRWRDAAVEAART